jgi:hypothetical protein
LTRCRFGLRAVGSGQGDRSPTTEPARGAGGRYAERGGYGLVLFASVMLVIIGCFNLVYGIAAIANSHVFTANAH